ncbi:sensor histidine kinase [Leifsonia kafniensis]|uniref:sensor histidine kinase n=1 Tax=Leifsonia kafniensis TaxID=475957 RepID=UPI0031E87AB9
MTETTEADQGKAPWGVPSAVMRYRWAFEPLLAVLFLGVWTVSAVWAGNASALQGTLLLAVAIAFSRLSPIGALASGVVALGVGVTGSDSVAPAWAYCFAGVVVCFGAAAHGTKVVRWIGLAGALVLAGVIGLIELSDGFSQANESIGGIWGAFAALVSFLIRVLVQVSLVLGAWAVGLALNLRAQNAERAAVSPADVASRISTGWTSIEAALMDRDSQNSSPIRRVSRLFGSVSYRQLSADIAIALIFLFVVLASGTSSPIEVVVSVGFSVSLAFRRISPTLALAIAWVSALLQMSFGLPILTANFAVLAVLYAASAYGGRVLKWVSLASVGLGAVIAALYLSGILTGWYRTELANADQVAPAVDVAGTLFRVAGVFIASVGVLGLSWTLGLLIRTWQNARLSRRQEVRAVEEQRIAQRTVVVEQERNRIARDMHDVVAHSLAVVIAQADGARYARASDPTAVDSALTTISATARDALADVRILLTQLRQQEAQGPQPVLADLDRLIEQMRGTGLAIVWTTAGAPQPLGSGAQLAIYRIIQEALTNALRHGDPDHRVHLALRWEHSSVTAVVTNAVCSDRPFDERAGVGHGLPGMRERAVLAGGTLETTLIDRRFTVIATLPILAGAASASNDTSL